ncbi:hypothetical protein SBA4_3100016 [Candidatus Sulfopaludibacter sp. SbA4]|nr:hypothetical protein SBA4_3100016 [Candidatus Sulfopaludibacter sp. SbA4]
MFHNDLGLPAIQCRAPAGYSNIPERRLDQGAILLHYGFRATTLACAAPAKRVAKTLAPDIE